MERAGTVLLRLAPIIGKSRLTKRADELNARITGDPVLHDYISSKHAVELAIDLLYRRQRATGQCNRRGNVLCLRADRGA
jgi:hypothetical protein